MPAREILQLGYPQLYEISEEIKKEELSEIKVVADDLIDTILAFREKHGFGMAIAAPQVGVIKRLICAHIGTALVFINPVLVNKSEEMIEVWDDCMCFPDLSVKVNRHVKCKLEYYDLDWNKCDLDLGSEMAQLLQHECDHLDGILAVMRAVDNKSFALRDVRQNLDLK